MVVTHSSRGEQEIHAAAHSQFSHLYRPGCCPREWRHSQWKLDPGPGGRPSFDLNYHNHDIASLVCPEICLMGNSRPYPADVNTGLNMLKPCFPFYNGGTMLSEIVSGRCEVSSTGPSPEQVPQSVCIIIPDAKRR